MCLFRLGRRICHQIARFVADQSALFRRVKQGLLRTMATAFLSHPPPGLVGRPLTERDAIDIWIARWLKVRRKDLVQRYNCDPRRLYEVWQEDRFPGSRAKALAEFRSRFPSLTDRIDPGPHTRVSRAPHPDQMALFD